MKAAHARPAHGDDNFDVDKDHFERILRPDLTRLLPQRIVDDAPLQEQGII